jgi:glycine oxidase
MKVDYIIVGQGLAGSAVAVQLLKRQKSIVVFDEPSSNNSSRIAAGLFNPVTGKKMVKTWLADKLFPVIHTYYNSVEKLSGQSFFFPMPVFRPFISAEEQNEWMARSAEPAYIPFIEKILLKPNFPGINDEFGGLLLKQSGWLDTNKYISSVAILIRQSGTLIHEIFNPENLDVNEDSIRYGNIEAGKIIFCSGTHQTKWFDWLPVRKLKGETITIKNNLLEKIVVNRGIYMIPQNQPGTWKIGATYNTQDMSDDPTLAGRLELEDKIKTLTLLPFEIQEHVAGFRPTTPDRRPIIGCHPHDSRLLVFNGLGTKGVSLAPYFSEVLVHSMENGGLINKEVDIERFKSLYSGSPK